MIPECATFLRCECFQAKLRLSFDIHQIMKAQFLIAALALVAPAASFAKHKPHVTFYSPEPYCPPPVRYYHPGPVVSFNFGSRPSTYTHTRSYSRSSSSLEASVQRALRREGYYDGPVDGDIGPRSRGAIREFQADNGLYITGRIDSRLLRSLGI